MNLLTRLILENYKKKYNSDSKIVVSNVEELCGIFQKCCAEDTTLIATNNTLLKKLCRRHNVLISPCGD